MTEWIEYEGFHLQPRPLRRRDDDQFTLIVHIRRGASVRAFMASNSFATFDEAFDACVRFGQSIVDGRVPGCSVEDLYQ